MPIQTAGSVRALALVGPTNSGKTTLLEALLQATGAVEKRAGHAITVGDSSPEAKSFATNYEAAYKAAPDIFASWSYDAVNVLALAINKAKSLDPQAIRTAILAVKGYKGAEGTYNFDKNGDGLHGYNIVKNEEGKIVFNKHIDFDE